MASWIKLKDLSYFCEYGTGSKGAVHCEHSTDYVDDADGDDPIRNAAHWAFTGDYKPNVPAFLCNFHYEELILGLLHGQDGETEPIEAQFAPVSGEEFASRIGEVK